MSLFPPFAVLPQPGGKPAIGNIKVSVLSLQPDAPGATAAQAGKVSAATRTRMASGPRAGEPSGGQRRALSNRAAKRGA